MKRNWNPFYGDQLNLNVTSDESQRPLCLSDTSFSPWVLMGTQQTCRQSRQNCSCEVRIRQALTIHKKKWKIPKALLYWPNAVTTISRRSSITACLGYSQRKNQGAGPVPWISQKNNRLSGSPKRFQPWKLSQISNSRLWSPPRLLFAP
jgi:hypothetical protein